MNTLDSIRSMHAASKVRLDACRATHATIVDHVNALLMSGQVEGVPFRLGEDATITGFAYKGDRIRITNIYLKRGNLRGNYSVVATGNRIKMNGEPGEAKGSAEIKID